MNPTDLKDEVSISLAGGIYKGWTGISVKRGIQSIAGAFDLTVTDNWSRPIPLAPKAWPFAPGDKCTVKVGTDSVITGFVDDVEVTYDGQNHQIRVSGRDAACDLVDCSATPKNFSNLTLLALVQKVCEPFGIKVIDNFKDTYKFPNITIASGDSPFHIIDKAARHRACLVYSDGIGNIILGKPGTTVSKTAIVQGQNAKKGSGKFSAKERYSLYTVFSQDGGWKAAIDPKVAQGVISSASDPVVTRYRPLQFKAESSTDIAGAERRAKWEASTRRGKSQAIQFVVDGHRQENGTLWTPNTLVQVVSPYFGINTPTNLLIVDVDYIQNGSEGTVTTLDLLPADALEVLKTVISDTELWHNFQRSGA